MAEEELYSVVQACGEQDTEGVSAPNLILQCGFQKVQASHFRPNTLKLGEQLALENIFNVQEEQASRTGKVTVSARCVRSTNRREEPYFLSLDINSVREVIAGRCSCAAGIDGDCKHCAALVFFINTERTEGSTDAPQAFHKPSEKARNMYPKGETVLELQGKAGDNIPGAAISFYPDEEALSSWEEDLETYGLTNSSAYKMMTAKPSGSDEQQQQPTWKEQFSMDELQALEIMFSSDGFLVPFEHTG